jgi:hypothetical protein
MITHENITTKRREHDCRGNEEKNHLPVGAYEDVLEMNVVELLVDSVLVRRVATVVLAQDD